MKPIKELKFICQWEGEPGAGIRAGQEVVTINFSAGFLDEIPEESIETLRDALKDIYDGASVETEEEYKKALADEDAYYAEQAKAFQ